MKTNIIILTLSFTFNLIGCIPKEALDVKQEVVKRSVFYSHKRWSEADLPITLYLNIDHRADIEPAVARAITRYNDAAGRTILAYQFESFHDDVYVETRKNRVFFQRGVIGEDTLVHTFLNTIEGQIYHSDIVFNADYDFLTGGVAYSHSFESSFMHALGHFLGEDHNKENDSVMRENGDHGLQPTLSEKDKARIRKRYE